MKKEKLFKSNHLFAKEIWFVKTALDIYDLIALNGHQMESGRTFFAETQRTYLNRAILGTSKIYEPENARYEYASIQGIVRLSKACSLVRTDVLQPFFKKYGVEGSTDWLIGIDRICAEKWSHFESRLKQINEARDTVIAHLQVNSAIDTQPPIPHFYELMEFAFDLHDVIDSAFFEASAHPIMDDRQAVGSLIRLLKATGIKDVKTSYPDEPLPMAYASNCS